MKSIILVQNPAAAQFFIARIKKKSNYVWLTYDSLAREILINEGLNVCDDHDLFNHQIDKVEELSKLANYLSCEWFKVLNFRNSPPLEIIPEELFHRTLNYIFDSILRGFHFINRFREEFEGRELITTRTDCIESSQGKRGEDSHSIMNALLLNFSDKWKFKVKYIHMRQAKSFKYDSKLLNSIRYRIINFTLKTFGNNPAGTVLFSGNPRLLDPVRSSLGENTSTSQLKFCSRLRHLNKLWDKNYICLPIGNTNRYFKEKFDVRILEKHKRALKDSGIFTYGEDDLFNVIWPYIERLYLNEIPNIMELYNASKKKFLSSKTRLLVVDEDATEFQRCLVHTARATHIKSIVVLHGLPGKRLGFVPFVANCLMSWGELSSKRLMAWGIPANKIIDTGCPKYDSLFKKSGKGAEKVKLCKDLDLDPHSPLILIMPRAIRANALELHFEELCQSTREIIKSIRYFIAIAQRTPEVSYVFKFRITGKAAKKALLEIIDVNGGNAKINIRWVMEGNGLFYIKASDYVFNNLSSAMLEAICMKKVIVQMNYSAFPDLFNVGAYGFKNIIRTYDETLELCMQIQNNNFNKERAIKDQHSLIRPFLYASDGQAARRIAEAINDKVESIISE